MEAIAKKQFQDRCVVCVFRELFNDGPTIYARSARKRGTPWTHTQGAPGTLGWCKFTVTAATLQFWKTYSVTQVSSVLYYSYMTSDWEHTLKTVHQICHNICNSFVILILHSNWEKNCKFIILGRIYTLLIKTSKNLTTTKQMCS